MSMNMEEVAALGHRLLDEVEKAVVGKRDVLELMLMALLADGHVLIEDYPGLLVVEPAGEVLLQPKGDSGTASRRVRIANAGEGPLRIDSIWIDKD